jgi:metallo-beta-lactamase family protein
VAKLTFVGAAGVVTGSKHLLETGSARVLLDCGMFQGGQALNQRNFSPPPVDPKHLDAIILSHGHLDHCGYLPALAKQGFRGPIFCTAATVEVANLVLRDSAHLQEDEARRAARHPDRDLEKNALYTHEDVERLANLFKAVPYDVDRADIKGCRFRFVDAGHILGSAITQFWFESRKLTYTGDIGRYNRPLLRDPVAVEQSDYVLTEATYGDRLHPQSDPQADLGDVINRSVQRHGVLVIPAFAIGRTQEILYAIGQLQRAGTISHDVKVFVDSPMGIEADAIMERHPESMRFDPKQRFGAHDMNVGAVNVTIAQSSQESIAINDIASGAVVISSSGMANGGRILHHLRNRLPRAQDSVCFVGFQSPGTLGHLLCAGSRSVRVLGVPVEVNAHIEHIDGFSAHADQNDLVRWFSNFKCKPSVFVVHAEPPSASALAKVLDEKLGLQVQAGVAGTCVEL